MKVSDYAEENLLSLKEDSLSSSTKITEFVPSGYSVIVPTVINPINQRPYPYGFVIRRDGVYRLNMDSVYAYNRTSTEPQTFTLTGDEWTSDDSESYKVSEHECLFTPVLPKESLGEREYLPNTVIDAIYTEIIKLGYFPKLYSLIYASDQVTQRYREVMLTDLKNFKEMIPYGIVLLFRMKDPYNLILYNRFYKDKRLRSWRKRIKGSFLYTLHLVQRFNYFYRHFTLYSSNNSSR